MIDPATWDRATIVTVVFGVGIIAFHFMGVAIQTIVEFVGYLVECVGTLNRSKNIDNKHDL